MKYKKFFITMLLIVTLAGFTSLITPFFLQVWEIKQVNLTLGHILFLLVIIVISKLINVVLTIYRERFAKEYNKKNLNSMLSSFLKMDYDSIIENGPMNMLEKIAMAVNSIYYYMTGDFIQIWSNLIVLISCLLFIVRIDYRLALLLLLLLPINYLGYKLLNKELLKRSKNMQEQTGAGFQEILSYIQQVDYIKQSSDYKHILNSLEPAGEKIYRSMARVNEFAQSVSTLLSGINDIAQNFALMYIVYIFVAENTSPYTLILSTIISPLYFSSIRSITDANIKRQDFKVALELQKDMDSKNEADGTHKISNIDVIGLNVNGITIPGRTLPFNAHGSLKKGDIVKVCGQSGTGKSSFAKALLKFRPIQGVLYNNIPIDKIINCELRGHIEYVSQNVPIIRGTLRDNLFFNQERTDALEEQIKNETILQSIFKSKTLDTEILEGGANLSGGEKQKIALARALMASADVLILDEICSNIDQETSNEIYQRIAVDRYNRITIIITHDVLPDGLINIELNQKS